MKLLVVLPEAREDRSNATEAEQHIESLCAAGHEIFSTRLARTGDSASPGSFRNTADLELLIKEHSPGLILVTVRDLVSLLPSELSIPVLVNEAKSEFLVNLLTKPDHRTPSVEVPRLRERIRRQWRLLKGFALPGMLGLGRPKEKPQGQGVIIVTRSDLFPADHGAAVRTLETARSLAKKGLRVGLVTDDRSHWLEFTATGMSKHRVPWRVRFFALPWPVSKLLHHSKNLPHSNSFLYRPLSDGSWFWRILAANKKIGASVLQAEFPAYASPCIDAAKTLACSVVLVEHNVEYNRLRDQVAELSDAQYDNLKAIEIDLCRRSDAVVCVSENDRQQLLSEGINADRLHLIPHGADLSAGDAEPQPGLREKLGITNSEPLLVYHGTYSYPPNREVLGVFANTLLPGLESRGLKCHLLAVGRDAPSASLHERIHFTGSVPELGPWLKAADMAVVPLTDGGGTRMKILDYFAARLPVVSTSKGIEGIPARNGIEAMIVDEWPAVIDTIVSLWNDKDKMTSVANAGRAYAQTLSWDEIGNRYLKVFSSIGG